MPITWRWSVALVLMVCSVTCRNDGLAATRKLPCKGFSMSLRGGVDAGTLSTDAKVALISRNLQEIIGKDELNEILKERPLKVYWGTATTGKPHVGYLLPMCKIADLLASGCEVTVLFADLHAFLDNMKAPWSLLLHRAAYYEALIKTVLESIGVPLEKLKFVRGTDFQLSREYTLDAYRLSSIVSEHDAKKAGAEVVKQVRNPLLSGLIYPLLQALDEEYLGCDAQFGGVDQRKIFMFAEKYLPSLGYKKRIHLMNPMVPGLQGSKMSSSAANSKIDLLDSPTTINQKLRKALCEEGVVEGNGVLAFVRHVIIPLQSLTNASPTIIVERSKRDGGTVTYASYEDLEVAFVAKQLHPLDLKKFVEMSINEILAPIRRKFEDPEMQKLASSAYPVEAESDDASSKTQTQRNVDISRLALCVGLVCSVSVHPRDVQMLVVDVNCGPEHGQRQVVVSQGLVQGDTLDQKKVVVCCNVPFWMSKGVSCNGTILCAFTADDPQQQAPVRPPEASQLGDLVWAVGLEPDRCGGPDGILNKKNKVYEKVLSEMSTDGECAVHFKDAKLITSAGSCVAHPLSNGRIR